MLPNMTCQEQRTGGRHKGDGESQRAHQGGHHRESHRMEHLPFDAAQREDWQVYQNDDEDADKAWTKYFARRIEHHLETLALF